MAQAKCLTRVYIRQPVSVVRCCESDLCFAAELGAVRPFRLCGF